ncbi:Uncharacterized protein FKW44_020279 [Caligus rogercresseyi]|uniref:Uncharacterized protein n=1 Tax=Caligus rogercresseyi TaxID=217165 RepID=A0A7T8GXK4_CALRO|nr:Uncharacterized protein FKW44_020279 [Caligus rogercresseyi]
MVVWSSSTDRSTCSRGGLQTSFQRRVETSGGGEKKVKGKKRRINTINIRRYYHRCMLVKKSVSEIRFRVSGLVRVSSPRPGSMDDPMRSPPKDLLLSGTDVIYE